ncbi:hypothetical protein PMAYCL1PPCAC_29976, partial [Pristionchus mayeri]
MRVKKIDSAASVRTAPEPSTADNDENESDSTISSVRSVRVKRSNVSASQQKTRESSILSNKDNADSESTHSGNTTKRSLKRIANRELPAVEEEEEDEEKEEKAVKGSIANMIDKLCEGGKKAVIKALLADPERLFAEATPNELRKVLWTTSVITTTEGLKLATLIFFEVGLDASMRLLKKRVIKDDIKAADCKKFGELLLRVYMTAMRRDKANDDWDGITGPLTDKAMGCWTDIADAAIRVPGLIGERFSAIFHTPLDMGDRAKYDRLISVSLEPVLWRYLDAPHDKVRFSASIILLRSFPITDKVEPEREVSLDKQFDHMYKMLVDECVEIRKEASMRVLRILSHFYSLATNSWLKKLIDQIVDKNSLDSVPAVRAAVLEGFIELIPVPEAINVTTRGLNRMIPPLIEDRSERVRLNAVRLLVKLRGHRHIKYHQMVPMEMIMGRLECETSDAVRKEIVGLVVSSFIPRNASADEKNNRIVRLIGYGRNAALVFHRLLVPLDLLSLEEAVNHMRNLCFLVYKNWRKGMPENHDLASVVGDVTSSFDTSAMSTASIDMSTMAIPALDEESFVFVRDKTILECAVVTWASIAKELRNPKNESKKKQVDKLMSKIFKKMFSSFRQTSLLGTVMCIGSLLPSDLLEEYSIQILSILKEKSVDDEILEPYLEAGAAWRLEDLMEIVREGLYELPTVLPTLSQLRHRTESPKKKKAKKSKLSPVEKIRQALHYLKYSLGTESICSKLVADCREQLEDCFEALSHVHEVADAYLDSMEDEHDDLKVLTADDMLSLYESATVLAVLMMEMPSSSSSPPPTPRVLFGRAASLRSAGTASVDSETEKDQPQSASSYSTFFFCSLHWMELSLLPRIGKCSSIERDKEQLQIRLAKTTLQHAETVLEACTRPPIAPNATTMNDLVKRLTGKEGVPSSEDEEVEAHRRRSSISSSGGSDEFVADQPQRSYLERLMGMLSALLHAKTPIVLLRSTLRLYEMIMGMDNDEGTEARRQGYDTLKAAIGIVKRAAEMPHNGEVLKPGHMDAVFVYTKAVITAYPDGPFPYSQLMGVVRAHCQRLMLQAIEERGIEDVTDHTYELHTLIELLLHRFIFRDNKMYKEFRSHLEQFVLNWDPEKYMREREEEE